MISLSTILFYYSSSSSPTPSFIALIVLMLVVIGSCVSYRSEVYVMRIVSGAHVHSQGNPTTPARALTLSMVGHTTCNFTFGISEVLSGSTASESILEMTTSCWNYFFPDTFQSFVLQGMQEQIVTGTEKLLQFQCRQYWEHGSIVQNHCP